MGNEVGAIMKKGFTLIQALFGLFLLGLISVTIIPILTSSLLSINKSMIKLEMNYIGEMSIERIKSFDEKNNSEVYIFDKSVSDIIELFRSQDTAEISLYQEIDRESYLLNITKEQRSNKLWMITAYVYHHNEGSNLGNVEYKTYLLQK